MVQVEYLFRLGSGHLVLDLVPIDPGCNIWSLWY